MTRMGTASHLGEIRRYSKGIRSSSKKSAIYSDYYEEDSAKETSLANQRSISLGALCQSPQPLLEPRISQLETLEAKMASIEVSLSTTTTTPRRKKTPVSSISSTPVPPASHHHPQQQQVFLGQPSSTPPSVGQPSAPPSSSGTQASPSGKERTSLGYSQPAETSGEPGGGRQTAERRAAQERLTRIRADIESKKLAIKTIKIALDTIDISDNIDVRIQQAELEYQLGREELNMLSLLEESRSLEATLQDNDLRRQTIFSYIANSLVFLHGVEIMYDPKSPQFGSAQREEGAGVLVEWAAETSGLLKGDRLLEVNGKVVGRGEEVSRLLNVSPSPAQLVVMRRELRTGPLESDGRTPDRLMSHLQAELSVVKEKAGEAERTSDSFRRDNLRLTHRISYLEEQVAELLERARETKPASMPQVFQKGSQVALVANLPGLDKSEANDLPQAKPRSSPEETKSSKSVDILVEKPKRKKELPSSRSMHSLDVECTHRKRLSDHLNGSPRQRHLREARSSLFNFLDRTKYDLDSESNVECASESSVHYEKRDKSNRPIPPKKPVRLSLSRATSLQSVDGSDKKSLKRTHKGEAPPVPTLLNGQKTQSKNYIYNGHSDSNLNGPTKEDLHLNTRSSSNTNISTSSHGPTQIGHPDSKPVQSHSQIHSSDNEFNNIRSSSHPTIYKSGHLSNQMNSSINRCDRLGPSDLHTSDKTHIHPSSRSSSNSNIFKSIHAPGQNNEHSNPQINLSSNRPCPSDIVSNERDHNHPSSRPSSNTNIYKSSHSSGQNHSPSTPQINPSSNRPSPSDNHSNDGDHIHPSSFLSSNSYKTSPSSGQNHGPSTPHINPSSNRPSPSDNHLNDGDHIHPSSFLSSNSNPYKTSPSSGQNHGPSTPHINPSSNRPSPSDNHSNDGDHIHPSSFLSSNSNPYKTSHSSGQNHGPSTPQINPSSNRPTPSDNRSNDGDHIHPSSPPSSNSNTYKASHSSGQNYGHSTSQINPPSNRPTSSDFHSNDKDHIRPSSRSSSNSNIYKSNHSSTQNNPTSNRPSPSDIHSNDKDHIHPSSRSSSNSNIYKSSHLSGQNPSNSNAAINPSSNRPSSSENPSNDNDHIHPNSRSSSSSNIYKSSYGNPQMNSSNNRPSPSDIHSNDRDHIHSNSRSSSNSNIYKSSYSSGQNHGHSHPQINPSNIHSNGNDHIHPSSRSSSQSNIYKSSQSIGLSSNQINYSSNRTDANPVKTNFPAHSSSRSNSDLKSIQIHGHSNTQVNIQPSNRPDLNVQTNGHSDSHSNNGNHIHSSRRSATHSNVQSQSSSLNNPSKCRSDSHPILSLDQNGHGVSSYSISQGQTPAPQVSSTSSNGHVKIKNPIINNIHKHHSNTVHITHSEGKWC